jgi:protein involved in polysaccharide export with SLBB domain
MLKIPWVSLISRNVKSDQLTDEQIKDFVNQAVASGLGYDQIERIALSKGLPSSELNKLKVRIEALQPTMGNKSVTKTALPDTLLKNIEGTQPVPDPLLVSNAVQENSDSVLSNMIYGHRIFRNSSLQTFEKASDIKAPDNYVVGLGDEFSIAVFGFSYYNETLKVDANGFINATGVGPINVKGLTFEKAKGLIRAKFAGYFDLSNNQLTVTLTYSRIITVNIVGEAFKPGSYKMPAINTAFNALIAVGGPNDIGSVRNIQIKRNGRVLKTFDTYEFLSNSNVKDDYFLEDNDFIFIPAASRVVSIQGEVKRPMRYELKGKENLTELLDFSGGLTAKAYTKLITIERLSDDGIQKLLLNISLDSLIENKKILVLKDGDEIRINAKSEELLQFVQVDGAVNMPGKFEWKEGEKISDLLKKSNGLKYESLLEKAFLVRLKTGFDKRIYFHQSERNYYQSQLFFKPHAKKGRFAESGFQCRF